VGSRGERASRRPPAARRAWPRPLAIAAVCWAAVVALRVAADARPDIVEAVYSRRLYAEVARGLAALTGRLPFSVAELLLGVCAVALAAAGGRLLARAGTRLRALAAAVALALLRAAAIAGAVVLVFDLLWGLNYDREPVATLLSYDVSPATAAELAALAQDLLSRAATLRAALPEDAAGAFQLPDSRSGALRRAARGYEAAAARGLRVPEVGGRPKPVALSPVMSYLGITGIFSPFTGEANVNMTVPDWTLPFTAAHELAHQRGFAREDEANYVGYVACRAHPDRDFQYSGTFEAGLYVLGALARADRAEYGRQRAALSPPLRRDLAVLAAWRARYTSRLGEVQDRVNDAYLKSQGQREGVRSYGRMVDLLVGERRMSSAARP
jgi:hypothetical protein